MITDIEISGNGVVEEDAGDGCTAFKIVPDLSRIEGDGWSDGEYDIVYSFDNPIANGMPAYSYLENVDITILDEYGEFVDTRKIWVNFISLI